MTITAAQLQVQVRVRSRYARCCLRLAACLMPINRRAALWVVRHAHVWVGTNAGQGWQWSRVDIDVRALDPKAVPHG